MAKTARSLTAPPVDQELELLRRIAGGDEDALADLYQQYAPGLLLYLTQRLGDPRLAEDVLQEIMLVVWRSASRFRGECRVRTWLLIIARSRAINAYHRQIKPASLDVQLEEAGQPLSGEPTEPYSDLHSALAGLAPEQRETLELVFFHGLSLQETAQVLNIAPGTVKSRLHRAKARLRNWMNAEGDEHA